MPKDLVTDEVVELPKYLITEEVADLLRTPAGTVRYWRHVGKGPRFFKVGGKRVLYAAEDVLEFIAQSRQGQVSA